MGFLDFFSRSHTKSESVVLIDIGTSMIAGAYVHYTTDELPAVLYARTEAIEMHSDEPKEAAMLRTLKAFGETLIKEGAPVLARATGSGTAHMILVSIDAPWQETVVHTEHFEEPEPFVFSQGLITKRLKETHKDPIEKVLVDESIIGTILNGYETKSPYGKKVHRASVIILTSLIESHVAAGIVSTLEHLYHSKNVLPIAGSSLRYQAMRQVFPHERDAIILDATNEELSSISLVRKGLIVCLIQTKVLSKTDGWAAAVTAELTELSKQYPLPRTIFLLAREPDVGSLKGKLDSVDFGALWLSDNPPKVVPVLKSHVSALVRQLTETPADIVTLLMTLYYQDARAKKQEF
jgi:hypothetical protein